MSDEHDSQWEVARETGDYSALLTKPALMRFVLREFPANVTWPPASEE